MTQAATKHPAGYHWAPVDERTAAFMALIDCEAWEVLDTAERLPALEEHARLYGGPKNWELHFGKHRGKTLGDIPDGYLEWALTVNDAGRQFRKFQERCREELARRKVAVSAVGYNEQRQCLR